MGYRPASKANMKSCIRVVYKCDNHEQKERSEEVVVISESCDNMEVRAMLQ